MHIEKLLKDKMRSSLGSLGIHFGQARILISLLDYDALTQREIAQGLDIKPATVTNLVKKMEVSGLIVRKQDTQDDRIMNVSLTEQGIKSAKISLEIMVELDNELRKSLDLDQVKDLTSSLITVRNSLGGDKPHIIK